MKRLMVLTILILALPKPIYGASYLSGREFADCQQRSKWLAEILANDPYNVTKIHDTNSIQSLIKGGIDSDWSDGRGRGLLHKLLEGADNDCHGVMKNKRMPFFPQKTFFLLLDAQCDPSRAYSSYSTPHETLSFIEEITDHPMRKEIKAALALWEKTVEQRDEEAFAKLAAAQKILAASVPAKRVSIAVQANSTKDVGTQTEDLATPPAYRE